MTGAGRPVDGAGRVTGPLVADGPARPVTLRDVAVRAGVDPGTASRALRPGTRHLVNAGTAGRVRAAAEALRYRPDLTATGLRGGPTRTAGLIVGELSDPAILPLIRGAEETLRQAGYMTLLACASDEAGQSRAMDGLLSRRADGLVIATAAHDPGLLAAAAATAIPVVAAGVIPARPGVPYAAIDLAAGARLIATHLASRGHRQVACLSSPDAPLPAAAIIAAAGQAGLIVPPALIAAAPAASAEDGWRSGAELLATGERFTAVMTGADLLAAGCCAALADAGHQCPAAVAVTGAGNHPLAARLSPALTTIQLPGYGVGAAAARLLLGLLGGADPARSLSVAPVLVPRLSTATSPGTGRDSSGTTGLRPGPGEGGMRLVR